MNTRHIQKNVLWNCHIGTLDTRQFIRQIARCDKTSWVRFKYVSKIFGLITVKLFRVQAFLSQAFLAKTVISVETLVFTELLTHYLLQ